MRDRLRSYNDLLTRTFIDIPSLETPVIERRVEAGPGEDQLNRVLVAPSQKFVRRIFSRGSWTLNGRFYGPWWQSVGSDWRKQIFINDAPTVEVDFQALHLHLLAARAGEVLTEDPYGFPRHTVPGTLEKLQRRIIKTLLLKAINARDRKTAFSSFRQDWPTDHTAKRMNNDDLARVIDIVLERYPVLRGKLGSDYSIGLMYVDSQITDHVLTNATRFNVPVLGIHDSLIVDYRRVRALKVWMRTSAEAVVGRNLLVKTSDPDAEALSHTDCVLSRQTSRSDGYVARLAEHGDKYGSLASVRIQRVRGE